MSCLKPQHQGMGPYTQVSPGQGDLHPRVEVDDEGSEAASEGGGGQPERHCGLSHAPFEGADAEYMHE